MRGISRTVLRTCAGLAVAAGLVAGGAGVASAATVTPAAHTTTTNFGHGCNPWQREHWNLNGRNKVEAVYLGTTYTYKVTFRQFGSCLTGTLTDWVLAHRSHRAGVRDDQPEPRHVQLHVSVRFGPGNQDLYRDHQPVGSGLRYLDSDR